MTKAQMNELRAREGINQGEEWDSSPGWSCRQPEVEGYLERVPFVAKGTRRLQRRGYRSTRFPRSR
jgi:hypothetical protein